MSDNLDNLRKIAEAATPGPWETLGGQGPFGTHAVCHRMEQGTLVEIAYRDAHFDKANAVHIATFDPPTVLALLTRLEQAEQAVARVLELADKWETGALRWEDPLRVPKEVFLLREALHQPTHEPDWSDYYPGDGSPACTCGYNGPYKECWESRRALDGDTRG